MRIIPIALTTATAPEEHVVLCRAYGAAQERCSRVMAQQQADITRLEGEVVRLQAAVMARDTALVQLQEQLGAAANAAKPRAARAGLAACSRVWQWLIPSRGAIAAEPSSRRLRDAADLTAAELVGCQGGWLSPGLDWPG